MQPGRAKKCNSTESTDAVMKSTACIYNQREVLAGRSKATFGRVFKLCKFFCVHCVLVRSTAAAATDEPGLL